MSFVSIIFLLNSFSNWCFFFHEVLLKQVNRSNFKTIEEKRLPNQYFVSSLQIEFLYHSNLPQLSMNIIDIDIILAILCLFSWAPDINNLKGFNLKRR